jgi:hypothetical protein
MRRSRYETLLTYDDTEISDGGVQKQCFVQGRRSAPDPRHASSPCSCGTGLVGRRAGSVGAGTGSGLPSDQLEAIVAVNLYPVSLGGRTVAAIPTLLDIFV